MGNRNTGITTRMLVSMLNDMLQNKNSTLVLVISRHGVNDCDYLFRKITELFNVLGIKFEKTGDFTLTYEHRWNGTPMCTRTVKVIPEPPLNKDIKEITRGYQHLIYWNN